MPTASAASEIAPPPHPRDELKSLALEADQFYASDDWKNADAPTRQKYLDRTAEVFDEAFASAESSLDAAEADSFYNSTTAFLQGKMAEHNSRDADEKRRRAAADKSMQVFTERQKVTPEQVSGVVKRSLEVAGGMSAQTRGSGVMKLDGEQGKPSIGVQPLDWTPSAEEFWKDRYDLTASQAEKLSARDFARSKGKEPLANDLLYRSEVAGEERAKLDARDYAFSKGEDAAGVAAAEREATIAYRRNAKLAELESTQSSAGNPKGRKLPFRVVRTNGMLNIEPEEGKAEETMLAAERMGLLTSEEAARLIPSGVEMDKEFASRPKAQGGLVTAVKEFGSAILPALGTAAGTAIGAAASKGDVSTAMVGGASGGSAALWLQNKVFGQVDQAQREANARAHPGWAQVGSFVPFLVSMFQKTPPALTTVGKMAQAAKVSLEPGTAAARWESALQSGVAMGRAGFSSGVQQRYVEGNKDVNPIDEGVRSFIAGGAMGILKPAKSILMAMTGKAVKDAAAVTFAEGLYDLAVHNKPIDFKAIADEAPGTFTAFALQNAVMGVFHKFQHRREMAKMAGKSAAAANTAAAEAAEAQAKRFRKDGFIESAIASEALAETHRRAAKQDEKAATEQYWKNVAKADEAAPQKPPKPPESSVPAPHPVIVMIDSAVAAHANELAALGHPSQLTLVTMPEGDTGLRYNPNTGRIEYDPVALERQAARMAPRQRAEWIKRAVSEEVLHAATDKYASESPENRTKLYDILKDKDAVAAAEEAYGKEAFDGLDTNQKAFEVARVLLQGPRALTEAAYRFFKGLLRWLDQKLKNLSPDTKELLDGIKTKLEAHESGKVEDAKTERVSDDEMSRRRTPLSQKDRRSLQNRAEEAGARLTGPERAWAERRLESISRNHQQIRREHADAKTVGEKLRLEIEMVEAENDWRKITGEEEIDIHHAVTAEDIKKDAERLYHRAQEIKAKLKNGEAITPQDRQDWKNAGMNPEELPKETKPGESPAKPALKSVEHTQANEGPLTERAAYGRTGDVYDAFGKVQRKAGEPKNEKAQSVPSVQKADESVRLPQKEVAPAAPSPEPVTPAAAKPEKSFRQLMDEQDAKDREMLAKAEKEGRIGEVPGYTPAVQLPDGRVVKSKSSKEGHGELAALFPDQKTVRGFVNNDTGKFMSSMEVARERMKPNVTPAPKAPAAAKPVEQMTPEAIRAAEAGQGTAGFRPLTNPVVAAGLDAIGVPEVQRTPDRLNAATLVDFPSEAWIKDYQRLRKQGARTYADIAHAKLVESAIVGGKPVSAAAVEAYGIKLPEGWTKRGDLWHPPDVTPTPQAPAPVVEAKTRLDLMLDGVERTGKELTIEVTDANRDNLTKIIETAEKRGLRASTDGRFVLIRPAEPQAKEPWQMTKAEAAEDIRKTHQAAMVKAQQTGEPWDRSWRGQGGRAWGWLTEPHEQAIRIALREGKPVPAEVLADYPDLAKQSPAPATPQSEGGIFGYSWADIRSKQQGGTLAALIRGKAVKPKAKESDFAVLEKHGMDWLYDNEKFGIIDRLGLPVERPSKKAVEAKATEGQFSIYQMERKDGMKWMVQSGEKRGFGDGIFDTKAEAEEYANTERTRQQERAAVVEREAQKERDEEAAKELRERDVNEYTAAIGATPLAAGKLKKTLMEQVAKRTAGKVYEGTRAQVAKQLLAAGFKPTSEQVDAVKDLTGAQMNRMDNKEQAAHEKRKREAGKKTEYRLENSEGNLFEVTKAEHDYAKWLEAAQVNAAPAPVTETAALRAKIVKGATVEVSLVRGSKLTHRAKVQDVDTQNGVVTVTFKKGKKFNGGETQTVRLDQVAPLKSVQTRMLNKLQFEGMTPEQQKQTEADAKEFDKLVRDHPEMGWYEWRVDDLAGTKSGDMDIAAERKRASIEAMEALGGDPTWNPKGNSVIKAELLPKLKAAIEEKAHELAREAPDSALSDDTDLLPQGESPEPAPTALVAAKPETPTINVLKYNDSTKITGTADGGLYATVRTIKRKSGQMAYEVKGYGKAEGQHPDLEQTYEARGEQEAIDAAKGIARREIAKQTPEPAAPKLRPSDGKGTGELLQGEAAPFNLVAETAADIAKREEREAAEQVAKEAKDAAEAKAKFDKEQGNLFDEDPFAIADSAPTTSLPVASVQRAVRVVAERLAGAMPHEVIADGSAFPDRVKEVFLERYGASGDLNRIRGAVVDGKIWINAAAIENPRQAIETFMHEAAGHGGTDMLLKAFGEKATAQLDAMLKRLFPDEHAAVKRSYPSREQVSETLAMIMEGVGPEMSAQHRTRWQRVVDWLRNALNKLGVKQWSANDVMALLRRGVDAVRKQRARAADVNTLSGSELTYAAREAGVVLTPEQTMYVINRDPAVTADVRARVSEARGDGPKMSVAGRVTPEQDRAYAAAVSRGDMETAQRMVKDAAVKKFGAPFVESESVQTQRIYVTKNANKQIAYSRERIANLPTDEQVKEQYLADRKAWESAVGDPDNATVDEIIDAIHRGIKPVNYTVEDALRYRDMEREGAEKEIRIAQAWKDRTPEGPERTHFQTGKPFVTKAYHATPFGRLETFDDGMLGAFTGAPSAKLAHFFAGSQKVAESYFVDSSWLLQQKGFLKLSGDQKAELVSAVREELGSNPSADEVANIAEEITGETYDPSPVENELHEVFVHLKNPLVHDFQGAGYRDTSYRELLERAEKEGRDGVVLANTYDAGPAALMDDRGPSTNVIAVLRGHSSQIKSAEPSGVPLSERFNPDTSDIRFSLKDENQATDSRANAHIIQHKSIPVEMIDRDQDYLNPDIVSRYEDAIRRGQSIEPPLLMVNPKTGRFTSVDGHHRIKAYKNLGITNIAAAERVMPPGQKYEIEQGLSIVSDEDTGNLRFRSGAESMGARQGNVSDRTGGGSESPEAEQADSRRAKPDYRKDRQTWRARPIGVDSFATASDYIQWVQGGRLIDRAGNPIRPDTSDIRFSLKDENPEATSTTKKAVMDKEREVAMLQGSADKLLQDIRKSGRPPTVEEMQQIAAIDSLIAKRQAEIQAEASNVAQGATPPEINIADLNAEPPDREETGESGPRTYGGKFDSMDAQRAERGLPPLARRFRKANRVLWDAAVKRFETEPKWADRLVDEISSGEKTVLTDEEFAGVFAQQIDLHNKRQEAADRARDPNLSEEEQRDALDQFQYYEKKLQASEILKGMAGSEAGAALQSLKLMANEDFSLAAMEARERKAKQSGLTPEEVDRIRDEATRIAKAQADLDARKAATEAAERIANAEAKIAEWSKIPSRVLEYAKQKVNEWVSAGNAASERLRARAGQVNVGVDPMILGDIFLFARGKIAQGMESFGNFAASTASEFGEWVRPYLKPAWDKAMKYLNTNQPGRKVSDKQKARQQAATEDAASIEDGIRAMAEEGLPDDMGRYVKRLANAYVKSGATTVKGVMARLHAFLDPVMGNPTDDVLLDLWTDYGKGKAATEDALKRLQSQIRQEALIVRQIIDAEAALVRSQAGEDVGDYLKLTGQQRVPVRDQARALAQQLNELKKKIPPPQGTAESRRQSALDALEKRTRNRIKDLRFEIAKGERTIKNRGVTPTSPNLEALRAELATVEAEHLAVFGRREATPEQKLKSAIKSAERAEQKALAELEAAKRGVFTRPVQKGAETRNEVLVIRARADAARAETQALKELVSPPLSDAQKRLDAALVARERWEQMLAGEQQPTSRQPQESLTQLEEDARMEIAAMRELAAQIRRDAKPATDPDDAKVRALEAAAAEYERRVNESDFTAKSKTTTVDSARVAQARALRDAALAAYNAAKNAAGVTEQTKIANRKAAMLRQIADLTDRLAKSDFEKRPPRPPVDLSKDPEAVRIASDLQEIKSNYAKRLLHYIKERRGGYEKFTDAMWTAITAERSLMGSGDLSAPRQGIRMAYSHPIMAAKAIWRSIRTIFSQKQAVSYEAERKLRPNYALYKPMKIQMPSVEAEAHDRMAEEGVRSNIEDWADIKLSGNPLLVLPKLVPKLLGHYVRASSRTFTTFLNELAADVADYRINELRDKPMSKIEKEALGDMINSGRGRGLKAGAGKLAQFVFYSANFLAARAKNLSGYHIWRRNSSMRIRKIALKEQFRAIAGWMVVSAISRYFYGDTGDDEDILDKAKRLFKLRVTDSDSGMEYDYTGGEAKLVRIGAALIEGISTTIQAMLSGQEEADKQRAFTSYATIGREIRSISAPWVGVATDLFTGSNYDGKVPTVPSIARDLTVPLAWRSADEFFERAGFAKTVVAKLQEAIGVGVSVTRDKTAPKERRYSR